MAHITLPNDDVSGNLRDGTDYAKGSYVYANDKALRDGINGGLDNTNLKAGAGIAASKIADTAVTLTATQTMSGKTLTSPAINGGTIESSPIGATTPAAGSFTSLTATSSFIPSLVPGQVQNLSWTRGTGATLGTITIASADGTDLSASNPAWVCIGSTTKVGGFVTLKVTANVTFIDDGGVSDLAGWTFGVTTGVAWNEWMPVTIYALNKDDTDAGLVFGFSRKPNADSFATGAIGDKNAVSSADDKNSIFIAGSITEADYNGKPAIAVGAIVMKKATTGDDWTFPPSNNAYGFGTHDLDYVYSVDYTMPISQNGATASKYFEDGAPGTAPNGFTTYNALQYRQSRDGYVALVGFFAGGNPGGSGTATLSLAGPLSAELPTSTTLFAGGGLIVYDGAGTDNLIQCQIGNTDNTVAFRETAGGSLIQNGTLDQNGDYIVFSIRYPAY